MKSPKNPSVFWKPSLLPVKVPPYLVKELVLTQGRLANWTMLNKERTAK